MNRELVLCRGQTLASTIKTLEIEWVKGYSIIIETERKGVSKMIRLQIQSDIQDNDFDIVKAAIAAEIKRLEIGLHKTEQQIAALEGKYGVPSETFLKELAAEDLKEGDREYVEWDGELKIRDRIVADLQKLRAIEYVAH
jgi:hypothetical protein